MGVNEKDTGNKHRLKYHTESELRLIQNVYHDNFLVASNGTLINCTLSLIQYWKAKVISYIYIYSSVQKREDLESTGKDISIDDTKMIKKLLPRIFIKKILSTKVAVSL